MSDYWIKCPLDIKEHIQQYLKYNLIKDFKIVTYKEDCDKYGKGYCSDCGVRYNRFQRKETYRYCDTDNKSYSDDSDEDISVYYLCFDCDYERIYEFADPWDDIRTTREKEYDVFRFHTIENVYEIAKFGISYKYYPKEDATTMFTYGLQQDTT